MKQKIIQLLLASVVFVFLIGAKPIKNHLCNDISINTELKNWRLDKGQKKYVISGKWDDYDENGTLNPIPDNIDVIVKVNIVSYLMKHSFLKGDNKVDDINIQVSVKLKLSETTDCTNLMNPVFTDAETILESQNISYDSFFKNDKYQAVEIKQPFKIRAMLKKAAKEGQKLSQIVVTIKMKSVKEETECIVEYIKPTC